MELIRRNLKTSLFLLAAIVVFSFLNPGISSALAQSQKPLVIVIVDSSVFGAISSSLHQYVIDVGSAGFSVSIIETDSLLDKTPSGIRSYLKDNYTENLAGVLLVGDVSEAWFKIKDHTFPTDMYYMDLNGLWFDLDNDGIFEARGGDISPEIWVGRLKVSTLTGDQISILNNYFTKNHAFRIGALNVPWWRSLIYIDDQGVFNRQEAEDSLSYVTPDETVVTDPQTTNTTDFKNRLKDFQGFEWLYLMSHGKFNEHGFYIPQNGTPEFEGTIYSSDYETINPRILFYQFFVCSAARYTEQNYLAGSAVFNTNWGLAAIGSTDDIYTISFESFFRTLSERETLGAALKQWFMTLVKEHKWEYLTELRYQFLLNAVTIIGDPTLSPIIEMHDVAITNLEIYIQNITGYETLIINVTAQNRGEFNERVNIEILYDSEKIFTINMILRAGESSTLTFSPINSHDLIWGTHSKHLVEAKTSIATGEFRQSDNSYITYFEGKIIENPAPFQLPPFIFPLLVNAIFALAAWNFLKQLMSDESILSVYIMKVRRFLLRMLTKTNTP